MEGNMLYHKYLKEGSKYFEPNNKSESKEEFYVDDLTTDCFVSTDENSIWKMYRFEGKTLPDQGWKIHISSTHYNAKSILRATSAILIKHKIFFKHIESAESLFSINSKNANRATSGKFIAIYPKNDDQFLYLLDALYNKIKDYDNGPYILSDKRWKGSNVYYRYGGFKSVYNENDELCIKDERGNLLRDERTPFYQVPDFVKKFDTHIESLNNNSYSKKEDVDDKLNLYTFHSALGFNNGGGIYLAERKNDNKYVIIKEARPKAGLDARSIDAVERQKKEYDALVQLSNIKGIVNVLDSFQSWEHHFIVEEYIEGDNLHSWITKNYPFMKSTDIKDYTYKAKTILSQLVSIVEEMHHKDVAMGDLQPANIIISNDLEVTLIDFETAKPIDSEERPGLRHIGFSSSHIKNSKDRDQYALHKLIRFCLIPIFSTEDMDDYMANHHYRWIAQVYGKELFRFVENIKTKDNHYSKDIRETTRSNNHYEIQKDIPSIINRLKIGMERNFTEDIKLINGDIRQYEYNGGKLNVLYGGSGAALAFRRTGNVNKKIIHWIEDYLIKNIDSVEHNGLLTGKSGIGTTLYEFGYKNDAISVFNNITNGLDNTDISLRSGLSGIGLVLISLYIEMKEKSYLEKAISVASMIDTFISESKELTVKDWSGVPIGLIDGWSGVSIFYSALYALTNDEEYYARSIELIKKDLKKTIRVFLHNPPKRWNKTYFSI